MLIGPRALPRTYWKRPVSRTVPSEISVSAKSSGGGSRWVASPNDGGAMRFTAEAVFFFFFLRGDSIFGMTAD